MQTARKSWLAAVINSGVIALVVVGAVAVLGPQVLPHGSWISPFTWNAPALTMARSEALDKESSRTSSVPVVNPDGEVVVLDNWNYTAIVRGRPQPSRHN